MNALPKPRTFVSSTSTGAVYDHGAHVVEWTPDDQQPVLWLSEKSAFEDGAPIRGGVPICFPWFGAGRSGDLAPAHGLARLATWSLVSVDDGVEQVTVVYRLTDADLDSGHGLGSFTALYAVSFGESLSLALEVTNTGDEVFTFEEALHTYLAVGDATQVTISGLDGAQYLDKAPGGAKQNTQSGDVTFTAETDRVYESTSDVTVTDPVLGRQLIVRKEGSAHTVVWNPWVDKAKAMPDFGDEEWRGMCCIEAANTGDHAVELQPGQSHKLVYTIDVAAR